VGPKVTTEELEILLEKLHYLSRGADFVVFAGSLPAGSRRASTPRRCATSTGRGVQVVLDSEGSRCGSAPRRSRGSSRPTSARPSTSSAGASGRGGLPDGARHDRRARRRNVHITLERGCYAPLPRGPQVRRYRASPRASSRSRRGAGDVSRAVHRRPLAGRRGGGAAAAVAPARASTLEVGPGRFDPKGGGRRVRSRALGAHTRGRGRVGRT
jgi:hypothetical protein